ncbi:amino acid permease [archaeon]|nr:amino acid permease [archaeon]
MGRKGKQVRRVSQEEAPVKKKIPDKKFGTFAGVFMPSLLTILGAVMYLILPQVVGGVGLFKTILIILIAHSVTVSTAYSISAISTNIKVKGGGLYYLISRSLGSEFGGSLGIQLYLAQTIAASFYAIAFARGFGAILGIFGVAIPEFQLALISLILFGIIVLIGAQFVVKLQYFILAAILLSLVSIFLGPNTIDLTSVVVASSGLSFWVAFAMFFPAVTGIDAGVGMSGELKDPKKSLVRGTFMAIFVTMAVYLVLVIKLSFSASANELLNNPQIMQKVALFSPLIILGIIMATSSSALSSLMTSPRCLVAMAEDKVLPKFLSFLGKKSKKSGEPRIAVVFSLIIGIGVITLGSLELVSQIVAMFFLSVYGWINGSAFFEKISHNPSYRPTFNAPTYVSFYGMMASYIVMYLFNPLIMISVIIIQGLLFFYLYKSSKSMKIEGVWAGVSFRFMKLFLKSMDKNAKTVKNWRPTLLAFSTKEINNHPIASLLHWISSKSSITKMYFLHKGKIGKDDEKTKQHQESLNKYVKDNEVDIFPRSIASENFKSTIEDLAQAETIGNLPLNTILLDFDKDLKLNDLTKNLKSLDKNLIILRNQSGFSGFKSVDVWWSSRRNGNFMILLAYLITHSKRWLEEGATIRVLNISDGSEESKKDIRHVEKVLKESRIENIELKVIPKEGRQIKSIIHEHSASSDLVILGLTNLAKSANKRLVDHIEKFTKKLKVSLVVFATDKIDFRVN